MADTVADLVTVGVADLVDSQAFSVQVIEPFSEQLQVLQPSADGNDSPTL